MFTLYCRFSYHRKKHGMLESFKEEKVTDQIGHWVSILDYAHLKGKSISTIRRSIKANAIKYKLEDGKYFIFCNNSKNNQNSDENLKYEVQALRLKVKELSEENSELKMLVKLYEDRSQLTFDFPIPELPQEL